MSLKKFGEAVLLQFQWIPALVTNKKRYSLSEQRRAMIYVGMHLCFLAVLGGHSLSLTASNALAFVLQVGATALSVMMLAFVEEYADTMEHSMAMERNYNQTFVAILSIRVFSLLHYSLMGSAWMLLAGLVEIGYDVYVAKKTYLLVDATTLWKCVEHLRREARIRCGYQAVMILTTFASFMLFLFGGQ